MYMYIIIVVNHMAERLTTVINLESENLRKNGLSHKTSPQNASLKEPPAKHCAEDATHRVPPSICLQNAAQRRPPTNPFPPPESESLEMTAHKSLPTNNRQNASNAPPKR